MTAAAKQTAHTPRSGFKRVTKDQFFATVGQMNVHPRVDVRTLKDVRPRSDWETPDRICHGVSVGHGEHAEFFVRATTPA